MRLKSIVFRAHHPGWAFAADSGKGASLHGGRFNPVGMEALYTSLRFQTAWLEAQQGFPFKAQPMTLVAYAADCEDILDLRDAATSSDWNIGPDDLGCAWERLVGRGAEPPTWTLARRLYAAGQAGIIVPSYAPGATADDVNVVFWRWGRDLPHQIRIIDDFGRLPRNQGSWH